MKQKFSTLAIATATLLFFAGCSNTTSHNNLPQNPKDKEEYKDESGNLWIWNAGAGYWGMSGGSYSGTNGISSDNGNNSYRYYPSTGKFTNSTGTTITPPTSISSGIKSATTTSSSKSSATKGVFGSTGKSHSISA